MPTVIETLVKIASDVNVQGSKEIEQLLISNNIDEAITTAILNKDIISLERQLDVCPDIVCIFVHPEDDEPKKDEDEDEEKDIENNKSVINF